jgi:hypothetical protein
MKAVVKKEKFSHNSDNIKRTVGEGVRKDTVLRFCRDVEQNLGDERSE